MIFAKINILLADDDKDDCDLFEEVLGELPITANLITVSDGVLLMKKLTELADNLPDIVFIDNNMPRKTGFECLKEIKRNKKFGHLPVIIISTASGQEVIDLFFENGAHYYIHKPNNFSYLKEAILNSILLTMNSNFLKPRKADFVLQ